MIAAGKKNAAKAKASGKGLFKVRTLSPALAAITGKSPRAHALALRVSGLRRRTFGGHLLARCSLSVEQWTASISFCSPSPLRASCRSKMATSAMVKAVWAYIKAKKSAKSACPNARHLKIVCIPVAVERARFCAEHYSQLLSRQKVPEPRSGRALFVR